METSADLVWRRAPTCPNRKDVVREVFTTDGASRVKLHLSDRVDILQQDFDDSTSVSWLIPLVVVVAIVAGVCAGLVVYSRRNKVRNESFCSDV